MADYGAAARDLFAPASLPDKWKCLQSPKKDV